MSDGKPVLPTLPDNPLLAFCVSKLWVRLGLYVVIPRSDVDAAGAVGHPVAEWEVVAGVARRQRWP